MGGMFALVHTFQTHLEDLVRTLDHVRVREDVVEAVRGQDDVTVSAPRAEGEAVHLRLTLST